MSTLVLKNQFGEQSENTVIAGTDLPGVGPAATLTVLSNLTGGTAQMSANTTQAIANKLPAKAGVQSVVAIPSPVSAITIALSTSGGNTYTDAAVNSAVNTALASVVTDLQTQLDKINVILAALKVVS